MAIRVSEMKMIFVIIGLLVVSTVSGEHIESFQDGPKDEGFNLDLNTLLKIAAIVFMCAAALSCCCNHRINSSNNNQLSHGQRGGTISQGGDHKSKNLNIGVPDLADARTTLRNLLPGTAQPLPNYGTTEPTGVLSLP